MSDDEFVRFLADDLEQLILREGPDTVAAFIAEPIQAAGGVLVPPPGYFPAIQEVLRRHDVLLIADEVVCGFGRLGCWFGSELFGIEPDLITVAKGLDLRLRPALGLPRLRARLERRRRRVEGRLRARLHVHRPSRRGGRGAGEPRHHRARRARRAGGGARREAQRAPPRGVRRPPARRRGPRHRV